jgi:ATP-binding cassette, subfamily C, bacterial
MSDQSSSFRLLVILFNKFPRRTTFLLGGMLLAGLAEGLGVATILPLLTQASDTGQENSSILNAAIGNLLDVVGLQPSIGIFLIIMVLSLWLKGIVSYVVMKKVDFTVAQISTDIRLALVRALMRVKWSYYVNQPSGTLANSMSNEAQRASGAYAAACRMIAAGFEACIYMFLSFLVSWEITVAGFVAGGILILVFGRLVRTMRSAGQQQAASFNSLIGRLTDGLQGIKALKAMAREDSLGPLLEAETNTLNVTMRLQARSAEIMRTMQEPLLAIFLGCGLYVALVDWVLPIETVLVMAFLFYRTVNRIGLLQAYYQGVAGTESFYYSVMGKIEEAEQQREAEHGQKAPNFAKSIDLIDVCFSYGNKLVIDNVSLSIPFGKITVLVGTSGAGKTTATDLVLGLLQPQKGRIQIDGVPLNEINIKSWRQEIGYVPQEMFLFHDTVRTNMTLGESDLSDDSVVAALKAAGAWDFVSKLEDGIDTVVGERGTKISGGQRQRIAIARALIRKPRLLVLDEPTTALDPKTEAEICQTLRELGEGVTILAISHQRALTEIADVVYKLADGNIEAVAPLNPTNQ